MTGLRVAVSDPAWFDTALARVAGEPGAIGGLFPAVSRRCGRGPWRDGWTVDDAVRVELLTALVLRGKELDASFKFAIIRRAAENQVKSVPHLRCRIASDLALQSRREFSRHLVGKGAIQKCQRLRRRRGDRTHLAARCGIRRVFIYRFGRQLFMFMEAADDFDMERDMPKYMEHPRAREWDQLMRTFHEPVPGAPPGSTWVPMREIYASESK